MSPAGPGAARTGLDGPPLAGSFRAEWERLAPIGRAQAGGYDRFAWAPVDDELRGWFTGAAARRDMAVEVDRNGNLWAWWGRPGPGAIVTGSHLDSVPGGGAYDGALGVAAAFAAIDHMRANGAAPERPVAVVSFVEEEGARFGVACLGSRLLAGSLDPGYARELRDERGTRLEQAMEAAGADPSRIGPDEERLGWISAFVELHVEQGRELAEIGAPLGVARSIWPHARWQLRFSGEANHAGTTPMASRRDPMVPFAATVLSARARAIELGGRATVGRVKVLPNAANGIAGSVEAHLDARAPGAGALEMLTAAILTDARAAAAEHRAELSERQVSVSPQVSFDPELSRLVARAAGSPAPPALDTAAGHDAGALAEHVPAAMLFTRNPTGASHTPAERCGLADCLAGVRALAAALAELAHK